MQLLADVTRFMRAERRRIRRARRRMARKLQFHKLGPMPLWRGLEGLENRILLSGSAESQAIELFDVSPALFVENQGQWEDDSVRYSFQGSGATVLHTTTGPVFHLFQQVGSDDAPAPGSISEGTSGGDDPLGRLEDVPEITSTSFSVTFDGAANVNPVGVDQSETVHNYFVGDQSLWRSEVPTFESVVYDGLYDGIDLYTWGRRDSLKYEFHVAPGSDYQQIQIRYEGVDDLWLDQDGALHVQPSGDAPEDGPGGWQELIDDAPYIYQEIGGERIEVSGAFELVDTDTVAFTIAGDWDPAHELILDPDLAWSTYVGGSTSSDPGYGVAYDGSGDVYVTGVTGSSGWTAGGFDTSHNGPLFGNDAFVAKLSSTGQHLWSTYLGGSDHDLGQGIASDGSGNVSDVTTLLPVIKRLRGRFGIENVCIVADRGMISAQTIETIETTYPDLKYILGARMRSDHEVRDVALGWPGRYQQVHGPRQKSKDPSPLKVKNVSFIDEQGRKRRYIVCHNEEQATKDRADREAILAALEDQLKRGDKALVGNKGYRKYLKTARRQFQIDRQKVQAEARFDGKWVLRTNWEQASAAEVALRYKDLWMVESIFRSMKSLLETRPIYHRCDETIRGHVFCSFLALVLRKALQDRLAEQGLVAEWARLLHDLDGLMQMELTVGEKRYHLRSETQGLVGQVFGACRLALPPTIREADA